MIVAPAPSPKSTQVLRSVQSTMVLSTSAPITSTVSAMPVAIRPSATCALYSQPLQAAPRSNAMARPAPSAACTSTAVAGSRWSGVAVPSTMRSISLADTPASSIARASGGGGEHGERLVRIGDVALPDAGAVADPGVVGVEPVGREIVVGDGAARHGVAGAGDVRDGTFHAADPGSASHAGHGLGESPADVRRHVGLVRRAGPRGSHS